MRNAVPGIGVALHLHQIGDPSNVAVIEAGFDPGAFPAYVSHYINVSPWLGGLEEQAEGALVHSEDVAPLDELLQSEFWNDWLKPQGDFAAGSALVLSRAFERNCAVVMNYSHEDEEMRRSADQLLTEVGPHIRQAFGLWRRAIVDRERLDMYQGCLGTLSMPLVIVDGHRKVRMANEGAEMILRRNDGLILGANREIRAQDRVADDRLGRAIADAAHTRCQRPVPILARRQDKTGPSGHYVLSAFPAPQHRDDPGLGTFSLSDGNLVALSIHDTSADLRIDPHLLSDSFGLTGTEADLSCFLLNGATLADYAKARRVSRYTVRNQLCSIMRKMGAHRQAELIGLLTRIALSA